MGSARRSLILTADDYGACESINCGIRAGIDAGAVNTVDGMVTFGRSLPDLAALHADYPRIGIGLHLSITSGFPVLPAYEVPTLVHPDGRFYTLEELVSRLHRVELAELESELRAQIERFLSSRVPLDHLSSQHNVLALYAPFFDLQAALARKYDVPVRSPIPASATIGELRDAPVRKRATRTAGRLALTHPFAALRLVGKTGIRVTGREQAQLDRLGIPHPSLMVAAFRGDPTEVNLKRILRNLPPGTSEFIFHLGITDPQEPVPSGVEADYYPMRERELGVATGPTLPQLLDELCFEVTRYAVLPRPQNR